MLWAMGKIINVSNACYCVRSLTMLRVIGFLDSQIHENSLVLGVTTARRN